MKYILFNKDENGNPNHAWVFEEGDMTPEIFWRTLGIGVLICLVCAGLVLLFLPPGVRPF